MLVCTHVHLDSVTMSMVSLEVLRTFTRALRVSGRIGPSGSIPPKTPKIPPPSSISVTSRLNAR